MAESTSNSSHKSGRLSVIPSRAVFDLSLPRGALLILNALGTYGDRNGWCWPSQGTIGERLGISQQAVSKYIKILVTAGYVESRIRFKKNGGRTSNKYRVVFDFADDLPSDGSEDESSENIEVSDHTTPRGCEGNNPQRLYPSQRPEVVETSYLNDSKNVPLKGKTEELASHTKDKKPKPPNVERSQLPSLNKEQDELKVQVESVAKQAAAEGGKNYVEQVRDLLKLAGARETEVKRFRNILSRLILDWDFAIAQKSIERRVTSNLSPSGRYIRDVLLSIEKDGIFLKSAA